MTYLHISNYLNMPYLHISNYLNMHFLSKFTFNGIVLCAVFGKYESLKLDSEL